MYYGLIVIKTLKKHVIHVNTRVKLRYVDASGSLRFTCYVLRVTLNLLRATLV